MATVTDLLSAINTRPISEPKCLLEQVEAIESFHAILRSYFLADQLKQDYDTTVAQIIEAIHATEEHEVLIEVLGDVIPARVEHKGNHWLHAQTDLQGNATYRLS